MSKVELIDSALLSLVSGAGCEVWEETCGCQSTQCCDTCGHYRERKPGETSAGAGGGV
jgi:hypothetical protein